MVLIMLMPVNADVDYMWVSGGRSHETVKPGNKDISSTVAEFELLPNFLCIS